MIGFGSKADAGGTANGSRGCSVERRTGLTWLDSHSKALHGASFIQLAAEKQNILLEPLAYKTKFRESGKTGREFFNTIREYTVMGFYTSEIGWKSFATSYFSSYAAPLKTCVATVPRTSV